MVDWIPMIFENITEFILSFVFEKLPYITIGAAVLFFIWKILEPAIMIT